MKQSPNAKLNIVPTLRGTVVAYGRQHVAAPVHPQPQATVDAPADRGVMDALTAAAASLAKSRLPLRGLPNRCAAADFSNIV